MPIIIDSLQKIDSFDIISFEGGIKIGIDDDPLHPLSHPKFCHHLV